MRPSSPTDTDPAVHDNYIASIMSPCFHDHSLYYIFLIIKSSFVLVKSNLDDFVGPEQFFAERFANSLVYGTE